MTELEPVAWKWEEYFTEWGKDANGEYKHSTMWDDEKPAAHPDIRDVTPLVTLSSAQSAIAERDARIAELEAENAALAAHACLFLDGSGVTGDEHGNSVCMLSRRLEAAEALLKEAERVLDIYGDPTGYIDHNGDQLPATTKIHEGLLAKLTAKKIRAARSLMSKIGERNGE